MQELEGEKMFKKFKYMIEKNFELKRGFDSNKDITKDQINEFINKGAIFIDVRSPLEFKEGHIESLSFCKLWRIKHTSPRFIGV